MPEPLVVPKDGPVEIKLGDDSVVKGASLDDAFKNLAEMKVNASKAIKETRDALDAEKQRRESIETELSSIKAELEKAKNPPPPPPKKQTDDKDFNKDTYFQLLGEDPRKAQNYLDAYRFGIENPDEVPVAFNSMREGLNRVSQQVDVFTQQNVTGMFLAQHPEYPQGDAGAAKLLTERVQQLVNEGMPYNSNVVEFAYFQLLNDDKIKPVEIKEDDQTQQPQKETPNPSLSGAGASLPEDVVKAEQMSDKDLIALLQSKGMFR